MTRIKIPLPSDEELRVIAEELLAENDLTVPVEIGLAIDALQVFFDEFPEDGYGPDPSYAGSGLPIQNFSTVHLLADADGMPYVHVRVYSDGGSWLFNGYVNLDRFTGYFLGSA